MNKAKKYLVSTTLTEAPWENTVIINTDVIQKIAKLKNQDGGSILIQGSTTLVKSIMAAGLVDELKLLIQPHIVGTTTGNFFEGINHALELVDLQQLENGVVLAKYQPKKLK